VSTALAGVGLGAAAGTGLFLAVTGTPLSRRPRLDDRLAPYLRDTPRPSRLLHERPSLTPFPTFERLLGPVLGDLVQGVERWVGGLSSVRRRLEQVGGTMTVEQFRAEQVLWGGFGLAAAFGLALLSMVLGGGADPLALVLSAVLLTALGVLARDRYLTRQVAQREGRMLEEFPTIAELLALAVTAGEGPVGALERVTRISAGELSRELGRALADARAGASLVQALEGISQRTSLAPLARFVDGVAIAVERGTPLADVLRAQAVDVREAGKRHLLESAGRREIAMMVPVVFLVLPVTVLFVMVPEGVAAVAAQGRRQGRCGAGEEGHRTIVPSACRRATRVSDEVVSEADVEDRVERGRIHVLAPNKDMPVRHDRHHATELTGSDDLPVRHRVPQHGVTALDGVEHVNYAGVVLG
jgi:tight adherence protein C